MRRHHCCAALIALFACKEASGPKPKNLIAEEKRAAAPMMSVLEKHARLAKKSELSPYVMFSADWCKPCVTFKKHSKTASIAAALEGSYLLILDYDEWQQEATALGVKGIPTWIEIGPAGPTDRMLDSSKWKDPSPGNIARAIEPFFRAGARPGR